MHTLLRNKIRSSALILILLIGASGTAHAAYAAPPGTSSGGAPGGSYGDQFREDYYGVSPSESKRLDNLKTPPADIDKSYNQIENQRNMDQRIEDNSRESKINSDKAREEDWQRRQDAARREEQSRRDADANK